MKPTHLPTFLICLVLLNVAGVRAQNPQSSSATGATATPVITVDEAVSLALANNRLIKNAMLEADKYDFRISSIKSRRLPEFQISALQSELLHPIDFTFQRGVFGVFPGIGPVPATNTNIRTPARLNTLAMAAMNQPLTQQYKIGLGIRAQELARDVAREELRAQRQRVANQVRAAYYDLVATSAGLEAARHSVKTLQEVKRVTTQYEAEQAVLKADVLQVQARLAKQEYQLVVAENGMKTQSEHMNQLLGRDLATEFRFAGIPEESDRELSLESARQQAADNRPELRQANLKKRLAEYDRRIAKADYIPNVSLTVRYLGIRSIEVLPGNAGAAGLYFSWEPFDWGRRRNAIAEKSKTVEQAANGIREIESQIAVEVGMRFRKWSEAVAKVKANRAAKDAAGEQLRVVTNKFKEQAALVKDVLQAEAQSADAGFQYQQALSEYWSALADLRKAMGEE
ncbi:MAG TPA: TolC family protein [Clostridia bacterium]|nr:TolC family protein [Clostridia bacterium]